MTASQVLRLLSDSPPIQAPEELAPPSSGSLGSAGRSAAIAAALELVGRYFATGTQDLTDSLGPSGRTDGADSELSELLSALRFRVALAAAEPLIVNLRRIIRHPTFSYRQRIIDSSGEISGQLDINRYITQMGSYSDTPSFPVIASYRSERTPENVLAAYAAQWLRDELRNSYKSSEAPVGGPEYTAWLSADKRLRETLETPQLASCTRAAAEVTRRDTQRRLTESVRQRLRRRVIPNPNPYLELLAWVEGLLENQLIAEPGQVVWSFYGERFDSKLFELWCLVTLGREIATALNQSLPVASRGWRGASPVYRFEGYFGVIEVHFQRRLGSESPHPALWSQQGGLPLLGTPDIVVFVEPVGQSAHTVLLDPKLKQRSGLPIEDVYKMLGYLYNFRLSPAIGFILSHTVALAEKEVVLYEDGNNGVAGVAQLNPVAGSDVTSASVQRVVAYILKLIGCGLPQPPDFRAVNSSGTEDAADTYAKGVQGWLVQWGRGNLDEVTPVEERVTAIIGFDRWNKISRDVQIMMATADYIGYKLTAGDFSGPAIGLCASVEDLLHSKVLEPALASAPEDRARRWTRQVQTFGNAIAAVKSAADGETGDFDRHLRSSLIRCGIEIAALGSLVPDWKLLNEKYRRPAAHPGVVAKQSWHDLYGLLLGSGALFVRTVDALAP